MNIRDDAQLIIKEAIDRAMPDNAVKAALGSVSLPHKVKLVAIGKAGYQMARAAYDHLGSRIEKGVIITKYGHSAGSFSEDIAIYEAGHPVPDGNSVRGAEAALSLAHSLTPKDTLIFLVSGGGSALFESPLVSLEELQDVNRQLLASGARYNRNEYHSQAALRSKGRQIRHGLQRRAHNRNNPFRYNRRPSGHDSLRPRLPRQLYQCRRPCRNFQVRPEAFRQSSVTYGYRDSQGAN